MRRQIVSRKPQFDRSRTHDVEMFIVPAARQDFLPGAVVPNRHPAYGRDQRVAVECVERGRVLEKRPDIAQLADHRARIARLAPFGRIDFSTTGWAGTISVRHGQPAFDRDIRQSSTG